MIQLHVREKRGLNNSGKREVERRSLARQCSVMFKIRCAISLDRVRRRVRSAIYM
jgi:hypothetical protein